MNCFLGVSLVFFAIVPVLVHLGVLLWLFLEFILERLVFLILGICWQGLNLLESLFLFGL
jgi:hypothetical protein